jgi:hypothetical protein
VDVLGRNAPDRGMIGPLGLDARIKKGKEVRGQGRVRSVEEASTVFCLNLLEMFQKRLDFIGFDDMEGG